MNSVTWWSCPRSGYFWNISASVRVLDVLLDGHQAFLAGLLQDVVQQRQQLHVARLGVLAALEAAAQARDGGLDHLHLVVGQEGAHRGTADGDHLERQRLQHDPMLPPWTMNTPKTQPITTSQPTMTNIENLCQVKPAASRVKRPNLLEPVSIISSDRSHT
jgi:hypothetical protein